jgi:hypothetical protein
MNVPAMLVSLTPANVPRLMMKSDPGRSREIPLFDAVASWWATMQ